MAQAGIHALVCATIRRITPIWEWLILGIILGSLFPDLDNYIAAVSAIAKAETRGLHRAFTHSIFTILVTVAVFFVVAQVLKQPSRLNLSVGFGIGIGLHMRTC